MNKKNIVYIILIISVLGIYNYFSDDSEQVVPTVNLLEQPLYQSDEISTKIYDLSGKLGYTIVAKSATYFEHTRNTEFELPNITIYDSKRMETWNVQSSHAFLTSNNMLYLQKNVQLDNLTPNAQLSQIRTANAKVDLTSQMITSNDEVTIQGNSFTSAGTGLEGNLHDKTANILENVKTFYHTENIQSETITPSENAE